MISGKGGDAWKKALMATTAVAGAVAAPFTAGASIPATAGAEAALTAGEAAAIGGATALPGVIGSMIPASQAPAAEAKSNMPAPQALTLNRQASPTGLPSGVPLQMPTQQSYALDMLKKGDNYA